MRMFLMQQEEEEDTKVPTQPSDAKVIDIISETE
jgi:hypothetical protein